MAAVEDPIFAAQMVGTGVGIIPHPGRSEVLSPADGVLLRVDAYSFIVLVAGSHGVLVHIGINTARLDGEGFEVLAAEGQQVSAGTPIVAWDSDRIGGPGISTTVIVALMDQPAEAIESDVAGTAVSAGEPIFTIRRSGAGSVQAPVC